MRGIKRSAEGKREKKRKTHGAVEVGCLLPRQRALFPAGGGTRVWDPCFSATAIVFLDFACFCATGRGGGYVAALDALQGGAAPAWGEEVEDRTGGASGEDASAGGSHFLLACAKFIGQCTKDMKSLTSQWLKSS